MITISQFSWLYSETSSWMHPVVLSFMGQNVSIVLVFFKVNAHIMISLAFRNKQKDSSFKWVFSIHTETEDKNKEPKELLTPLHTNTHPRANRDPLWDSVFCPVLETFPLVTINSTMVTLALFTTHKVYQEHVVVMFNPKMNIFLHEENIRKNKIFS